MNNKQNKRTFKRESYNVRGVLKEFPENVESFGKKVIVLLH